MRGLMFDAIQGRWRLEKTAFLITDLEIEATSQ